MTARNKLLGFLSKNADMLTPQQAARVEAMSKVSGPVGALGVVGGCLSARDCQSLLRRWTARAEMFRGAWKICRFRDGGPDHAGMLKYDYAATALEAAIREMREQMEAATVRQPTDNAEVCNEPSAEKKP